MRLRIVSALAFIARLASHEIIYADDFHLRGVPWIRTCPTLTDTTPLKAPIEELLLTFQRLLYLAKFKLLLLHQFLETVFELFLELGLFF